jgi:hypothetical protein
LLDHGRVMTVSIDPANDAVGPWATVKQAMMPSLKREHTAAKMLKAGATPLMEAVSAAQNYADGKAIDGCLALRKGQPAYDVIRAYEVKMILINPATDQLLSYWKKRHASRCATKCSSLGRQARNMLQPTEKEIVRRSKSSTM